MEPSTPSTPDPTGSASAEVASTVVPSAEEQLVAHSLLAALEDGVLLVDSAGRVTYHNRRAAALWGLPTPLPAHDAGRELFTYLGDQLADPAPFWSMVQAGSDDHASGEQQPSEHRTTLTFQDGRSFDLLVRKPEAGSPLQGRIWLFRDRTEPTRLALELDACRAELRAVSQEQAQLLATVRQMGTPVLPIYRQILVMPLVGHIDTARSAFIMDALLEAIAHHQAEVVIIDITGVSLVDTSVANTLIQTVLAAELLGAKSVLVGISAAVSRTIVQLGVDLSQVVTRRDLQAGIAYALKHTGHAIKRTREEPDWLVELTPNHGDLAPKAKSPAK